MHRTIYNILLPQRADSSFPSLPLKECTGVRYVKITKFSRMDSLPYFFTHGAPLRARELRLRYHKPTLFPIVLGDFGCDVTCQACREVREEDGKKLPSPCTASFQALSVNAFFRWRIRDERPAISFPEDAILMVSDGDRDIKVALFFWPVYRRK